MKIAFTSCMSAFGYPNQLVWDEIAEQSCDHLVLLGDSVYYDCDGLGTGVVKNMKEQDFAEHAYERRAEQLKVSSFVSLVRTGGLQTHAIWDDHDFLFNDACGSDVTKGNPVTAALIAPSRYFFALFRTALAQRLAPGSFPTQCPAWHKNSPPPGYSFVDLSPQVVLHLTDGRSFKSSRGKKSLLGVTQLDAIEAKCDASPPGTVHLLASGSVFEQNGGESWAHCAAEHDRLLQLANNHHIIMLSGDIHQNQIASYPTTAGPLIEATASGASVGLLIGQGPVRRNWGLLTIDADSVRIELFKLGALQYSRTGKLASWAW